MWLLVIIILILLFYYYLIKKNPYKYWIEKGLKQDNISFSVLGDFLKVITGRQNVIVLIEKAYNAIGKKRYYGSHFYIKPSLLVRDPDLIKAITVKDFDHFMDRRPLIEESIDPVWGKNLFSLKGEKWRTMRSKVSPAFTGSKMRQMFVLMSETSDQFVNFFLKKKEDIIVLDVKDVFTMFCNDLIASTAFGIKIDTFEDPDNEFYKMGKIITDASGFTFIKILLQGGCPKLAQLLNIKVFNEKASKFFQKIITDNIEYRRKNSVSRPDVIDLLLEAQKKADLEDESAKISDLEIVSQILIFFFAGFETVSTLMSFMAYELVANPAVQEKLLQEIDEICQNKKELTYDDISKMKYLDMVVSETLRKWPANPTMDRICTKRYTIKPERPWEKPLTIEEGNMVQIINWGIQHDPEFYPDPERFDPERFNEENKSKINPYTYLPFGVGPRNCIGSRLAILETKTIFIYLLKHFEIVAVDKTVIPIKLDPKTPMLRSEGGIWLGFKRRSTDL